MLQDLNKVELVKHYDKLINEIDIKTELDISENQNGDVTFLNDRRFFMINTVNREILNNFCFLIEHSNHLGKLIITPNYIDDENFRILE